MAVPHILFAGGGDERDSLPLHEHFARWVDGGKLLFLPTALVNLPAMESSFRWLEEVFEPLGVVHIDMWPDLAGKTGVDLVAFDAVYIGGGNTFYLLQQLREQRVDEALRDFILAGHPVFGGSAGAIVLGADITSCAHIDEDIVGLKDLRGLEMALGCTVWCHYQSADQERIQAFVAQTGSPSIALTERAGVYREGDQLIAAGYDPLLLFTGGQPQTYQPGEIINLV